MNEKMLKALAKSIEARSAYHADVTNTDAQGFEVERIIEGGICEVNLVARQGSGELRRSWLF